MREFEKAYSRATGDDSVYGGGEMAFEQTLRGALGVLASSANPDPGVDLDLSTKQTRGSLNFQESIDCDCSGRVVSFKDDGNSSSSPGWTPFPLIGMHPAEGEAEIPVCKSFGTGVHCVAFERSRVGGHGQFGAAVMFPGAGVPYRWSQIDYILRCDKTYAIHYSASFFPAHQAYLDGNSERTRYQFHLAEFMFAGDAKGAPGGQFHVKRGKLKN